MCDTFVALPAMTADGSIIFGKNSDREPNEAQALEYHPARVHPAGAAVKCTYMAIPQTRQTLAVLICRPFWMWGAEMGANEKGVVIGNEAVFTRMPYKKEGGLLGMDLLRLALERSATAEAALETLVKLLAEFGQGGPCGYEDKRLRYHNSFILADPEQAWVLETAGPLWAAVKVRDYYAISNRLTIGEAFDLAHPDLIDHARRQGWLKKGRTFDFAQVYSDWFYTTFAAGEARRSRAVELLAESRGRLDEIQAFRILRDHGREPYRPGGHLWLDRICAHSANGLSRHAAQSTGSLAARLKGTERTFWATGTSSPCLSLFKPIWFQGPVLPDLGPAPEGIFNPETPWWRHEALHRRAILDYPARGRIIHPQRDEIQKSLVTRTKTRGSTERFNLTAEAFQQAQAATEKWIEAVTLMPVYQGAGWVFRRYWNAQNRKARLVTA
ncbi:MAG: C69 family dipeptidase [Thermodesulfobacteriota bacterium]